MLRDRLQSYRDKRDFDRTSEPSGRKRRKGKTRGLSYVIQKHEARATHFDFRLEHDGVLLSWAVPKGPSLNPADKRLAVHVEDHPIEYGSFEGAIPKNQYGGGTVMLWDRGTWQPQAETDDVDAALEKGSLKFILHGERMRGGWALVRLRARRKRDRGRDNWLLIKEKDDEAKPGRKPVVDTAKTSVASGRTMTEIARGGDIWQSGESKARVMKKLAKGKTSEKSKPKAVKTKKRKTSRAKKKSSKSKSSRTASKKKKAKTGRARLPAFVAPQLATLVDTAPAGSEWLHEIKYDGYRALASIGGAVVIRTRKGLDWTDPFHTLVEPLSKLPCDSALLDGEIAIADAEGHTDFSALQIALSEGRGGFSYYVFDLLHLDGKDLRLLPLRARKEKLAKLLARAPKRGPLFLSEHIEGKGADVFQHACDLKLEGIISKRAGDRYRSGRTTSWLKTKCGMAQEFVVIGWRPSRKAVRPFSSILLAVREDGELRYCGRVGSGYSEARLDDLAALFETYARKTAPVENIPPEISRDAKFLEPVLVAEVAFRGWTGDGMVRQGSFKGLRSDKPAKEVTREWPMAKSKVAKGKATKSKTSKAKTGEGKKPVGARRSHAKDRDEIEGVRVTHPDRVMFGKDGASKRDLIDYYLAVADRILPHVAGRPLSLVRCPRGSEGECFFQKHASEGWPEEFRNVRIKEKSGSDQYLYIEDERGLVAAAQMSVLELHLWGSRVDDVEKPDRLVFDLDPDEEMAFGKVKDAARELRDRLSDVGLQSFPMLTGGKGIHVIVPLTRKHSWDDHRNFAEAMARVMAEEDPERYVATMSKAKRRGKIFIDYLRNQRGATAIAPYSTRARAGASVAWPVSWQTLGRYDNARPAGVADAAKKMPRRDPWPGYFKLKQSLPLGKKR